jgi:hypothetical protein
MPESWSDRRPAPRRGPDPLEQRLDRLVSAGRQLVDGVSGARPGARASGRAGLPRLDGLGRWVENKLDWILEDEDDWREPWQEGRDESGFQPNPQSGPESRSAAPGWATSRSATPSRRRPLDAISRRRPEPQQAAPQQLEASEWPEDDAFVVPRWQRQASASPSPSGAAPPAAATAPGRAVPRSTRRRSAG